MGYRCRPYQKRRQCRRSRRYRPRGCSYGCYVYCDHCDRDFQGFPLRRLTAEIYLSD